MEVRPVSYQLPLGHQGDLIELCRICIVLASNALAWSWVNRCGMGLRQSALMRSVFYARRQGWTLFPMAHPSGCAALMTTEQGSRL